MFNRAASACLTALLGLAGASAARAQSADAKAGAFDTIHLTAGRSTILEPSRR